MGFDLKYILNGCELVFIDTGKNKTKYFTDKKTHVSIGEHDYNIENGAMINRTLFYKTGIATPLKFKKQDVVNVNDDGTINIIYYPSSKEFKANNDATLLKQMFKIWQDNIHKFTFYIVIVIAIMVASDIMGYAESFAPVNP